MSIISDTVKLQRWAGVEPDGMYGQRTAAALVEKLGLADDEEPAPVTAGVDDRSAKNIATLLPPVQPLARALIHAASNQDIIIKVISGTRTYAEQDALYAKGRTTPGPKVTNAKGGFSNHNFGIAFDIGIFRGGAYIPESPIYKVIGSLGKNLGLQWGGDWQSIVDEPHFEYNPKGFTVSQMRERKAAGQPVV